MVLLGQVGELGRGMSTRDEMRRQTGRVRRAGCASLLGLPKRALPASGTCYTCACLVSLVCPGVAQATARCEAQSQARAANLPLNRSGLCSMGSWKPWRSVLRRLRAVLCVGSVSFKYEIDHRPTGPPYAAFFRKGKGAFFFKTRITRKLNLFQNAMSFGRQRLPAAICWFIPPKREISLS